MVLVRAQECYLIVGACFHVYNDKGCGFLEPVYQECLELELAYRGIPFVSQQMFDLYYRGKLLNSKYRADLVVENSVLVELKAVSALTDDHRAQVLNYLAASNLDLGLLVNFGSSKGLSYERIIPRSKTS